MKNLALTWRPTRFEDVAGQEIVVRLLRNSLYRNRLFPAYLFMGQRGCGKTTLARIFAAALNCGEYEAFLTAPKTSFLPCGQCTSCSAMAAGQHPDFIEVDAASHTGVDDVRSMMETMVLLPQIGRKRVYLIDEAHMLSKSAANALLKTLEEPPSTVMFLLATTDAHKIIDTVRSRCFPLTLHPHTRETTIARLIQVCQKEQIDYSEDGLQLVAQHCDGSLRDALNSIEQIVLAYGKVTHDEAQKIIGLPTTDHIVALLTAIIHQEPSKLIELLQHQTTTSYDPKKLLAYLIESVQTLLWLLHHQTKPGWEQYTATLNNLIQKTHSARIHQILDALFHIDIALTKSSCPHILVPTLLLKICQQSEKPTPHTTTSSSQPHTMSPSVKPIVSSPTSLEKKNVQPEEQPSSRHPAQDQWEQALHTIAQTSDTLYTSIVQQLRTAHITVQGNQWHITVASALSLWHDTIMGLQNNIEKILTDIIKSPVKITIAFATASKQQTTHTATSSPRQIKVSSKIDMVAPEDQEMVRKVLEIFPGTVSQTKGPTS